MCDDWLSFGDRDDGEEQQACDEKRYFEKNSDEHQNEIKVIIDPTGRVRMKKAKAVRSGNQVKSTES